MLILMLVMRSPCMLELRMHREQRLSNGAYGGEQMLTSLGKHAGNLKLALASSPQVIQAGKHKKHMQVIPASKLEGRTYLGANTHFHSMVRVQAIQFTCSRCALILSTAHLTG